MLHLPFSSTTTKDSWVSTMSPNWNICGLAMRKLGKWWDDGVWIVYILISPSVPFLVDLTPEITNFIIFPMNVVEFHYVFKYTSGIDHISKRKVDHTLCILFPDGMTSWSTGMEYNGIISLLDNMCSCRSKNATIAIYAMTGIWCNPVVALWCQSWLWVLNI